MPTRDAISRNTLKKMIPPQSVADNTALVSSIIDTLGYDKVMIGILTGSIADADATFTVLLEEGDNSALSDNAAVADEDMVSQTIGTAPETAAAFQFDDDNEVRKIAYIGSKRYIRLTITPAANASAALIAAFALLSGRDPARATETQPAS